MKPKSASLGFQAKGRALPCYRTAASLQRFLPPVTPGEEPLCKTGELYHRPVESRKQIELGPRPLGPAHRTNP